MHIIDAVHVAADAARSVICASVCVLSVCSAHGWTLQKSAELLVSWFWVWTPCGPKEPR